MGAPGRGGLTAEEAAVLWAAGRFGGTSALCAGLGEEVAQVLGPRLGALGGMEEAARAELLDEWALEDRLAADPLVAWAQGGEEAQRAHMRALDVRWQQVVSAGLRHESGEGPERARDAGVRRVAMREAMRELVRGSERRRVELVGGDDGLDPGWFARVAPARLGLVLMRVGMFELVESLRAHDRRDLARLLRDLPEPHRGWAVTDLRRVRTLEAAERARAQEVFVAMSKRHDGWEARALHAGLYFVAAAAGRRLASRLEGLHGRLPAAYEEAMWGYHRALVAGTRRGLAPQVRRSLGLIRAELELVGGVDGGLG
jgi:hypothetical protein